MKFVSFMKLVGVILTLSVKAPVLFSYQVFKWLCKIDAHKVFQCFIMQEVILFVMMLAFIASPYYGSIGLIVFLITVFLVAPVVLFLMTGRKTSSEAWLYIMRGDKERYEEKFNRQMAKINKLSTDKQDTTEKATTGIKEEVEPKKESAKEIQERIAKKVAEEQKIFSDYSIISSNTTKDEQPAEDSDKLSDADVEFIDSEMDALFGNLEETDDTPVPEVPEVTEEVIKTTEDEKVSVVADTNEDDEIDIYVPTFDDLIPQTATQASENIDCRLNDFIDNESIKDANSGDIDKGFNNNVSESSGYGMLSGSSDDDDEEV